MQINWKQVVFVKESMLIQSCSKALRTALAGQKLTGQQSGPNCELLLSNRSADSRCHFTVEAFMHFYFHKEKLHTLEPQTRVRKNNENLAEEE